MRIRKNVIAPTILLAVYAVGSLAVGPVLAFTAAAAPASAGVAVTVKPDMVVLHS